MAEGAKGNVWERTNVTNLLRNGVSGTYYARVKVGNKQKWRSLKTDAFSVAKLRLGHAEKEMRAHASATSTDSTKAGGGGRWCRASSPPSARIDAHAELSASTKVRRAGAIKSLEKSWPELPGRDIRRVTASDCRGWAAALKRTGTGSDRTHGKPPSPFWLPRNGRTLVTRTALAADDDAAGKLLLAALRSSLPAALGPQLSGAVQEWRD